jgi:hypothetical protein
MSAVTFLRGGSPINPDLKTVSAATVGWAMPTLLHYNTQGMMPVHLYGQQQWDR